LRFLGLMEERLGTPDRFQVTIETLRVVLSGIQESSLLPDIVKKCQALLSEFQDRQHRHKNRIRARELDLGTQSPTDLARMEAASQNPLFSCSMVLSPPPGGALSPSELLPNRSLSRRPNSLLPGGKRASTGASL